MLKVNEFIQTISFFSGIGLILLNLCLFFKTFLANVGIILLSLITPLSVGISNYNDLGNNLTIFIISFKLFTIIHAVFLIATIYPFLVTLGKDRKNVAITIFGYINIVWVICSIITIILATFMYIMLVIAFNKSAL